MGQLEEFLALRKTYIRNRFSHLNPMQQKAVVTAKGPLLILAGAGSGKTTVLVNRIASLIQFGQGYQSEKVFGTIGEKEIEELKGCIDEGREYPYPSLLSVSAVAPYRILAITFTNKAAKELRERIEDKVPSGQDVKAFTFHALCMRILRIEGDKIGFTSSFTVYDTQDQIGVMKAVYKALNIDDKMVPIRSALGQISRLKDRYLSFNDDIEGEITGISPRTIVEVYKEYQQTLIGANAMDFDDLIFHVVTLFKEHPSVLEKYQEKYPYIMVDEYQDTNQIQYSLISMLAEKYKNLCVVGDDDQSIYRFRGATVENILQFEYQFPGAVVIKLEENYRSTKRILSCANGVISHNQNRKDKALWTSNPDGEKVRHVSLESERDEADFVVEQIMEFAKSGVPLSEIGILYRTNAQSNIIEQYLTKAGILYRIYGGLRFYDRKEVKDVVAYLSVVNNTQDSLRLRRIINEPKRGIGDATLAKATEIADGLGVSLFEVLREANQYPALKGRSQGLMEFCGTILRYQRESDSKNLYDLASDLLMDMGYIPSLEALGKEGTSRLENVHGFLDTISVFSKENPEGNLQDFLEEISLVTSLDAYGEGEQAVALMTIHSSKGLEFDHVFVVGLEEGLFPGGQAQFDPLELEEERRLCYVAMTRGRKNLFLSHAVCRVQYGKTKRNPPSRFFEELVSSDLEQVDRRVAPSFSSFSPRTAGGGGFSLGQSFSVGKKTQTTTTITSFSVGDMVSHKIFGQGSILHTVPMGNDTLLTISFTKVGEKKIMANFAKLEKL